MTDDVRTAALWLAGVRDIPHPLVPHMREKFGLSALEACHAIRQAEDLRQKRKEP